MAASNLFVTVRDPDALIAGDDPLATFAVAYIQVYRYTSEANARADSGGTLIDAGSGYTWALVASTSAVTEEAGPYRFGYYDSSQTASSWYRYRFANSGLTSFSQLSEPWEADARPSWALRDILWEVGRLFGNLVKRGTAATNADAGLIDCAALLKSTLLDANLYDGWHILVSEDAGGAGAAPEGETGRIASVDTATGIATLDADLTAAVTNGDVFLMSAYLDWTEFLGVLNRTRENMQILATVDIALYQTVDRYPLPWGVKHETDVINGYGVLQYANSDVEDEFSLDYRVEFDGTRGWLYIPQPQGTNLARMRLLRSYRDLEGDLSAMSDTTQAPIEWLRPVVAYEIARYLVESDPEEPIFQSLASSLEGDAARASGHYAPEVVRKARQGAGRRFLPGPAMVN